MGKGNGEGFYSGWGSKRKEVNIGTYYLTSEVDIWWNTVKGRLLGPKFTRSKFLEELRGKFYAVVAQRQKEKEFMG